MRALRFVAFLLFCCFVIQAAGLLKRNELLVHYCILATGLLACAFVVLSRQMTVSFGSRLVLGGSIPGLIIKNKIPWIAIVPLSTSFLFQLWLLTFRRHSSYHLASIGLDLLGVFGLGAYTAWLLGQMRSFAAAVGLPSLGVSAVPPKSAKFLLLLIPKRDREGLVGDLEEEYVEIVLPEYGPTKARFWYWWQVATTLTVYLLAPLKRLFFALMALRIR